MNQTNNHKKYFKDNNNFYANIGINAGFSKSKSETDSHIENAVVSTITGKDANSTITYSNVKNITCQGTQAKDTSAVYNNVETITKEAVELNNRYSSSSSSFGVNAGAAIGYGHKMQTTGNGGSVSFGRSSQNTVETVYHNGSFTNVNEVHNNTGTMTVSGFNQEGGKVTGNINNLIVESRQNTSTTTGRSSGINIGVSSQGIPSSLGISGSRTEGSRAYVDNQTTFIAGEGSSLTVGKAENTGAVISAIENGTIDIQSYTGKDIQNYDTMKTAGGSVGFTTGNVPVSSIGFNQETRDKEGTARNTVTGNVTTKETAGDTVNRDISKANETTKDTQSRTNINVESQTIQYAANPDKLKEDLNKAGQEIRDVAGAFNESVNDRGDDNRNFFGQLRETRLNETIYNIAGERLDKSKTQEDIRKTLEATYKDLGYDVRIRFSTGEETQALKGKSGTAYVGDDGVLTAIINLDYLNGKIKGEIIGVISEEASHVINGYEGRQIATGTDEKGLESTGRTTNEYFKEKYKDDNTRIALTSEGAIDTSKLGTNVGDKVAVSNLENIEKYKNWKELQVARFFLLSSEYFKDEKGNYYDKDFMGYLLEKIGELYNNNEFLKEVNDDDEIFKMLTQDFKEKANKERGNGISENINFSSKDDIIMNKETGYLEIVKRSENPDLLTLAYRGMIDDPNQTTVFKIIDSEINPAQNIFLENLGEKIKNSKLPKKEEYFQEYRKIWNNMFSDGNITVNPEDTSFLLIQINPKSTIEIYVPEKNERGLIERVVTSESTISSKIAHEGAGHTTDKSSRRNDMLKEIKKERKFKTYEDSKIGMIYSSDRYEIEGDEVFFYPTRTGEFLATRMESEIYRMQGKPERIYYNKDDAVFFRRIRFSGNYPNLDELFDKAMKGEY